MLINQVTGLKTKMETSEEGSAADSGPTATAAASSEVNGGGTTNGRAAYGEIASKAVGMTESIKHAIVLLQIAKVVSC